MERAHLLIPVLQHRETKAKLALARVSREVSESRAQLDSIDQMIAGVSARVTAALSTRDSNSPRLIAEMTDLEEQLKALRAARAHLAGLHGQAQETLNELIVRHRQATREWRHQEARLDHIQALVRQARLSRDLRATEREDEFQSEDLAAARSVG